MLTVTAPGLTFTLPTRWDEVTLGQFLAYLSGDGDTLSPLTCFASDVSALHQLDAGAESKLLAAMSFLEAVPDFQTLPAPKIIAGAVVPEAVNLCPLICLWSFEQWVKVTLPEGVPDNYINTAPGLLGIYLYTPLTGNVFTGIGQLVEVRDRIDNLPVLEALALSAFFLRSYNRRQPSGRVSFSISYPEARRSAWRRMLSLNWWAIVSYRRWRFWPASGG